MRRDEVQHLGCGALALASILLPGLPVSSMRRMDSVELFVNVLEVVERTMHTLNRRQALLSLLFGAGFVGLRSLATGLPTAFFLNPRKAMASDASACAAPDKAQSFGRTVFAAVGVDPAVINAQITSGQVVSGALA